jgi:hypothetical protein
MVGGDLAVLFSSSWGKGENFHGQRRNFWLFDGEY